MNETVTQKLKPSQQKPWLQFYSEEAKKSALPEKTIYSYMRENNEGFEQNTAINYFDNKISYGELIATADNCAASFAQLGIKKGDIVACCSATIPEMAMALYGLNKIGASMLALDPRRSVVEIKQFMISSGARVLMLLDIAFDHVSCMLEELECLETVVIISADNYMPFLTRTLKRIKMPAPQIPYSDSIIDWKRFLSLGKGKETETAAYGENDLAAITLTGGTTGAPKGVMISNDGFNAIAVDFRYCGVSYTRSHRFMDILPAFSSYGIVASLHMPFSLGLELIMIPKFDSDKVGHYIKKYKPSHTLLVPAHYEKLMHSKEMSKGFDLSFFRTAGSGGDTMNAGLESKLNNFLADHGCKYPLSQGYGMSEASSAVSCCCNGNFKSLSVGYPLLTTTIGIFKPGTTEELDYGEEGEICITGPTVMLGYFDNPKETEKVLIKHTDGRVWIHSGDLGSIDEDGYLFIKGRIKRMITRFDGHKIFPVQLEGIIGKHKDVLSCAVVGVKDNEHAQGMHALAVIQLKPGADSTAAREELYAMLDNDAEERARPQFMEFVAEMPHAGMGKIDYKKLADDFEKNQTA
ncbi:MAG: class I adenylate-forming enzyme family protein [Bacillota bacterium]|nr:class I adenylate-forming enzyme family protein [Bacillota bacterium]